MKMPKGFYRTGNYSVDHTTYGGEIYPSDFNTYYSGNSKNGSSIAARIISDWRFDESCKKNDKTRIHNNNWRNVNGNKE